MCGCGNKAVTQSASAIAQADTSRTICPDYAEVTPKYVFMYAENQPADYPTSLGAFRFAYLVHERSEGKIQIRVYTDSELGDETDLYRELQYGGVDFMRASLTGLTQFDEEANVLVMPYLYESSEHMWKVLDGEIGQEIMDSFEGTGMVPLSWYDAGVRNFYMREEASTLEDFAGKSIRIQDSAMMKDVITLLGAQYVVLEYDEVFSALQLGRVDGAENNYSSYESMGHNEVAPYYIEDEHTRIPELQLVSQATYDRLSDEEKEIIRECAKESALYERQLWAEREEFSKNAILQEGGTIVKLTDEERAKFQEAVQPVYELYVGNYMDLIERIRAEAQETD
ncbi:MAG: TRAP transporter substrate-binding protein [Lachnospiraceae bacterium]|nr:TRAP transporter substrate-binding protein [Lachnospiraceae bacterium]